jgi:zinc protease
VQDLATRPISQDELDRQVEPVRQFLNRAVYSNVFWMSQLEGYSVDQRRLSAIGTLARDLLEVTPADLQALAARYLTRDRSWSAVVLARGMPMPLIDRARETVGAPAGGSAAPAAH